MPAPAVDGKKSINMVFVDCGLQRDRDYKEGRIGNKFTSKTMNAKRRQCEAIFKRIEKAAPGDLNVNFALCILTTGILPEDDDAVESAFSSFGESMNPSTTLYILQKHNTISFFCPLGFFVLEASNREGK